MTQAPPRRALTVSIINYRTGALTLQCLASALTNIAGLDASIVVVDNASGDGSAEEIESWIATQDPPVPVTLVRSATNSGFSGGHNQGMAAGPADFYLILNSDALLRPGFCRTMLATAADHPRAGLFAPRIEYEDGTQQTSCFRFPSPLSELIRGAASGPITRIFARADVPLAMPPAPDEIGWASFACILLRDAMVQVIGPMDEGYFLYFEDTEYCLRASRAGWGIVHVPEARAVHFRGGSGPVKAMAAAKKRLPAYFYASRSRFLYQAHGMAGLWAANLLWIAGRGLARLRVLMGKPVPRPNEAEARDLWINAFAPLGDPHAKRD
ncbi:glycosyltransferase [bacterium]|nr:glycosyltransferase [bacterium]